MSKNIVLCSDGTGNSTMKGRGTNVFKIYEAIDVNGHRFDQTLREQVAFYDDGVGTETMKFLKILGGAFGWGLSRNVRQLYAALARCYVPGDQIYLFGFSRGAFTVRQLAGFIIGCGIIDRQHWQADGALQKLVRKAFRIYRKRYRTWLGKKLFSSNKKELAEFRKAKAYNHETHAPDGEVRIRFIGVWDTVAAVGLPFDHLAGFINNVLYRFKFPDLQLSSRVDKACHALAIDDERHSFHPEVWNEIEEKQNERMEQVWFPGVHANIGGGYMKQGLSLVALDWMMAKAEAQDLRFIESVRTSVRERQNAYDKLYDSRSGGGAYYRYKIRDIGKYCSDCGISPDIHIGALQRIKMGTEGYAPVNLPIGLKVVATDSPALTESEVSESLTKLEAWLNDGLSTGQRKTSQANKWKLVRRLSHYAFLAVTIAVVLAAERGDPTATVESTFANAILKVAGFFLPESAANAVIKPLLAQPAFGFSLVGLLIIFYGIGLWSRAKINSIYSVFWCGVFRRDATK